MNQELGLNSSIIRSDTVATRARIVAAAERLFASHGIDAVSLARINRAARQRNRSALQYHFRDKRGLLDAILDKHTPGIEQRRHALLDELESRPELDLRSLAQALVLPVAEKLRDPDGGVAFVRINAELLGHPRFQLFSIEAGRVNRAADRLRRLTARAAPPLPEPLWVPRWLLVTGLLFHGLADGSRAHERSGPSDEAWSLFVEHLVDAIVAVLAAPASPATRERLGSLPPSRPETP